MANAPKAPKRKPRPVRANKPRARKSARPKKKKRPLWVRILTWTLVTLVSLGLIGLSAIAVYYASIPIPDPNADFQTNTTFIYYRDGKKQLGSFQVQNRQSIDFAEMSPYAINAIIAAENRSFWEDPGISIPAMIRASFDAITGQDVTGASTITQQYIKVLYLTQDKSMSRKVREIFLATKMGQELSKEQILEGYLNTVYFGRGAYGIAAASQAYFNKPQSELTLPEAVALVCIINNPSLLDPKGGEKHTADLLERYQYTLNGMRVLSDQSRLVGMERFTEADRLQIYYTLPEFPEPKNANSRLGGPKGFLLKMVEQELLKNGLSEEEINGGGLKIITTFDANLQAAAVRVAQDMTKEASDGNKKLIANLHAGLASIDNATGGMLAIYGGPDYVKNYINWATTPRPTGSTFKPYALTAALQNGWTFNDTLNGNQFTPDGDKTKVSNGGHNYGRITLLRATTNSVNSAYVDLVSQIPSGPQEVISAANAAGAPTETDWSIDNRIALGKAQVSPYYQAAAYSTFANQGMRVTPHVVAQVTDSEGNVIYTGPSTPQREISEDVATDVAYALTKVAQDGTGWRAAQLGYPVAGKTGTAYNSARTTTVASWFVGFTKQITTAVMYVAGDGYASLDGYSAGFYGSGIPAMTWLEYMKAAMEGKEEVDFAGPTDRRATKAPVVKKKPTKEAKEESATPKSTPSATKTATQQPVEPVAPPVTSEEPVPPPAETTTEAPQPAPPPTSEVPQPAPAQVTVAAVKVPKAFKLGAKI